MKEVNITYMTYRIMSRLVCVQPGPKANVSERKAAMSAGQQFIKEKGYSSRTQVTHFPIP